jgi:hypothetical protein
VLLFVRIENIARMYADVTTKVINESKSRGDQYSKMLVRAELIKEYITF